jgi:hypothetical protein
VAQAVAQAAAQQHKAFCVEDAWRMAMAMEDSRLTQVFEMLVERLGRLEAAQERMQRSIMHKAEWGAAGARVSAVELGGPSVMLTKAYDGPSHAKVMALTGHEDGFMGDSCVFYATAAWSRGERGAWDGDLEAVWGAERLRSVRAACAVWWRGKDEEDASFTRTDAGLEFGHDYVDYEIFEVVLRRRYPGLIAYGPCGCVFHAENGRGMEEAARLLERAREVLAEANQAEDILPACAEVQVVPAVFPVRLVCAILRENMDDAKKEWLLLSKNKRAAVLEHAGEGENRQVVTKRDVKRMCMRIDPRGEADV